MKILLIEDNKELTDSLVKALQPHYLVDVAQTGKDGIWKGRINRYDVIVLDVGLPDMNGLEVCRSIREKETDTPIIVMTVLSEDEKKIDLFEAGADDYVIKPVSVAELLARLQALTRRRSINQPKEHILQVGELVLDEKRRTVKYKDTPIELRAKEFGLLEFLMRNKGIVLSRGKILEHVWESSVDPMTNTVDVHVKFLRDKVDRPFDNHFIRTVPGAGYKLEG